MFSVGIGARQPNYLVTADDVDTLLAIEVQPLDDRKRKVIILRCGWFFYVWYNVAFPKTSGNYEAICLYIISMPSEMALKTILAV